MTENEYAERLEKYRLQIERLIEINEAKDARADRLQIEVEALQVKYDHLERQFLRLLASRAKVN